MTVYFPSFEPLSVATIARALKRTPVTPNQVSVVSLGVAGAGLSRVRLREQHHGRRADANVVHCGRCRRRPGACEGDGFSIGQLPGRGARPLRPRSDSDGAGDVVMVC